MEFMAKQGITKKGIEEVYRRLDRSALETEEVEKIENLEEDVEEGKVEEKLCVRYYSGGTSNL